MFVEVQLRPVRLIRLFAGENGGLGFGTNSKKGLRQIAVAPLALLTHWVKLELKCWQFFFIIVGVPISLSFSQSLFFGREAHPVSSLGPPFLS